MIEGINVRCTVGGFEVLRSPLIEITDKRRVIVSTATVVLPDADGTVRSGLSVNDKVKIVLSYRGDTALEQVWHGEVETITQEPSGDALRITALGKEKTLITTFVTESFHQEPASLVAKRLLALTGEQVAEIDIGTDILPYQVFSKVNIARAIKQLEVSLTRAFDYDMTKHALYLSENGWVWNNKDAKGAVFRVATAENLLTHNPPKNETSMGEIVSVLLPGLKASRLVSIRDKRRDFVKTVRAQEVIHRCGAKGNQTIIRYGKEEGWG